MSTGEMAVRLMKQNVRVDYLRGSKLLTSSIAMGREDSGAIFCRHVMGEHEHFYGLGEDNDGYFGSMDRRGVTRDMVTGQRIHIGHVTADIPVTFFMSTGDGAPYGIFVDNSYRMYTDDGVSYGCTRGDFTYTDITCEETAHQTRSRITRSNLLYAADRYLLQIHVGTVPENVAYGGRTLDQHGYKRLVLRQVQSGAVCAHSC